MLFHRSLPSPADGRNVAFGRVLLGLDAVVRASNVFAVNLKPATPVAIRACGALPPGEWAAVDKAVADAAKALAAAAAAPVAAAGKAPKQPKVAQPVAAAAAAAPGAAPLAA